MTATRLEVTTTSFVNEFSHFGLMVWVFVYERSGSGFESRCCHLNFRYCACLEQGVLWHSGNYRVWIHSETRTWHDKNIFHKFQTFHSEYLLVYNFLSCFFHFSWKWVLLILFLAPLSTCLFSRLFIIMLQS